MTGMGARSLGYFAGVVSLVALGWILAGQAGGPKQEGIPTDWSHHHVIFSQPSTDAQAARVMNEPRYWQQWNREHLVRTLNPASIGLSAASSFPTAAVSHGDWSQNLGSGANAGAGVYPAKYSFKITTATCASGTTPDYVVFSTGLLGSVSQASIVAFDNLYSGCSGIVPTVYWAYNTGGQILTSPTISGDGKQVAFVQTNGSDMLREVFRDKELIGDVDEFCTIAAPGDENALSALPCSAGHTNCYVSPYGDVFPCVQFPLITGNVRTQRFLDIWRYSDRMNEVRSIRLKHLTTCTSCSHVAGCSRCPGLAFMEGNMRGPSSLDCEKSFARTGVPSANMLAKQRTAAPLVQIRVAAVPAEVPHTGAIA